MIIEAHQVQRHSVETGKDLFTLTPGVNARFDDIVQYGGRSYRVVRLQRVTEGGAAVVLATYKGKL